MTEIDKFSSSFHLGRWAGCAMIKKVIKSEENATKIILWFIWLLGTTERVFQFSHWLISNFNSRNSFSWLFSFSLRWICISKHQETDFMNSNKTLTLDFFLFLFVFPCPKSLIKTEIKKCLRTPENFPAHKRRKSCEISENWLRCAGESN